MAIHVIGAVIGAAIVVATGWSILVTLVVPRRVRSNIPRAVFVANRSVFHFLADRTSSYERRDRVLAVQAPVQLVAQVIAWLALYELGFGLLLWPLMGSGGFGGALEQAGSSLCTLGFIVPRAHSAVALDCLAGLSGLGTVALQISYLPTLYGAFNKREALITMLDSRASVPAWGPELLARTHYGLGTGISAVAELPQLFEQWEQWSADVSETHTTYVPLVWFRSPRPLSSWVTSQLAGARRGGPLSGAPAQWVRTHSGEALPEGRFHLSGQYRPGAQDPDPRRRRPDHRHLADLRRLRGSHRAIAARRLSHRSSS